MNFTKILLAGLVGAVLAFFLGYLVWGVLLSDFFEANAGSATGVGRDEMQWIPMILGHLTWGFFFALIFERWANISTFVTGLKTGAILGFLVSFTFDMISFGSSNLSNLTGTLVNTLMMTIIAALVGGVVAWMLGRGK